MSAHSEFGGFFRFTGPSRVSKALASVSGLLRGVVADDTIDAREVALLVAWMREHDDVASRHPFNEVFPCLEAVLARPERVDVEQVRDVLWVCERLADRDHDDFVAREMQELQGLLGGIAANGAVTMAELAALADWLDERPALAWSWPYSEIRALVMDVRQDGKIDDDEHRDLLAFFGEFTRTSDHRAISAVEIRRGGQIVTTCATCPEVEFKGRSFCITGKSKRAQRAEIEALLVSLGARTTGKVDRSLDYLVVGADGNPCWKFACYGRKVEAAVDLRKLGAPLILVHENDLWDAVEDAR